MGGVDLEIDRLPVDPFVAPCNACCLCLNFLLDGGEIIKLAARLVMELGPLGLACDAGGGMWHMDLVGFGSIISFAGDIDKLKDQWASSDDAASAREEISPDNVLEDR